MDKEVILTGLRINNDYHLGNYIGAILPMVELINSKLSTTDKYQINLFIPDLHSLTTPVDFNKFQHLIADNLKLLIASGIDINKDGVYLYRQSFLPAHSQLCWILNNFSSFGELKRMTEFKDKSSKLPASSISAGLFGYPVLMAADILLYDATWVPVGDDQKQHLEFCRNLAQRFNHRTKRPVFKVPAAFEDQQTFIGRRVAPRIRNLKKPEIKMSKSDQGELGVIFLKDSPEEVSDKIMSATTDGVGQINFDWDNQPGIANLLTILALMSDQEQEQVNRDWLGKTSYDQLKRSVVEAVNNRLELIKNRLNEIEADLISDHLIKTEAHLEKVGFEKIEEVLKSIGLRG